MRGVQFSVTASDVRGRLALVFIDPDCCGKYRPIVPRGTFAEKVITPYTYLPRCQAIRKILSIGAGEVKFKTSINYSVTHLFPKGGEPGHLSKFPEYKCIFHLQSTLSKCGEKPKYIKISQSYR